MAVGDLPLRQTVTASGRNEQDMRDVSCRQSLPTQTTAIHSAAASAASWAFKASRASPAAASLAAFFWEPMPVPMITSFTAKRKYHMLAGMVDGLPNAHVLLQYEVHTGSWRGPSHLSSQC